MADIRQRTKPRSSGESSKVDKPQPSQPLPEQIRRYDEESNRISLPDIARLFFLLLFSSFALSYFVTGDSVIWGFKPWFSRWPMLVSKLVRQDSLAHLLLE